ncbi:MAG: porin family protein [Janthinobacterium lividum]
MLTSSWHRPCPSGLTRGGNLAGYRANTNNYFRNTTSSLLGGQVGVFYQLPLSKHLALVPEIQYSLERFTLTKTNDMLDYDAYYRTRLSYLNVPVLLRATLGPLYVEAGAQAGVLIGGRETGQSRFGLAASTLPEGMREVTGRYQRFDVGPSVGVGAKLPMGLGLNVRAYQGVVSLTQNSEATSGRLYRQNVQASLTYQLSGH